MKYLSILIYTIFFVLTGCISTEGTVELEGNVYDIQTKVSVPCRKVIIQGFVSSNQKLIDAGYFYTDNLGHFAYTLKKIKGAYSYSFHFVGDSAYSASTQELFLIYLNENSKFLSFYLTKLANLTFTIVKTDKETSSDEILYFSWKSDGVDGKTIYPYQVINYGKPPIFDFKWIGNNINSIIQTKALAGKKVIISCEIVNGKVKKEIVDTIICKLNQDNNFTFKY